MFIRPAIFPGSHVAPVYLSAIAQNPAMTRIKRRGTELMRLRRGSATLDIGCGPGTDTINRARIVGPTGHVAGIDIDPVMVAAANRTAFHAGVRGWTHHQVANSAALPFWNASFDACYSERLIQHLPGPAAIATIGEAARVTKPGGWIVFVDTDWATLSIDSDPIDLSIERRICYWNLHRFANGYSGRELYRMFRERGIGNVSYELFDVPLRYGYILALLSGVGRTALAMGVITIIEWGRWRRSLSYRNRSRRFFAHLSMIAVAGQKL